MHTPWVTAHRGSMATHPENTMAAFRHAEQVGADELELDVQLSADGVSIVCHDETVDRTTDGSGAVASLTAQQLAALDAGDGRGLPTVEAVLRSTRLPFQVEIKAPGAARPLAQHVVRDARAEHRVRFISFDHETLRECRRLAPQVARGLITATDVEAAAHEARELGATMLCVHWPLVTEAVVTEVRRLGLRLASYVVDPSDAPRAIALGLDSLTTNDPAAMRLLVDAAR